MLDPFVSEWKTEPKQLTCHTPKCSRHFWQPMSFLFWKKKTSPQLHIGDVEVRFDNNLLGLLLCAHEGVFLTGTRLQQDLRSQISTLLSRPIFNSEHEHGKHDCILHIAITDLRGGSVLNVPAPIVDFDLLVPFRPSITLQGYLVSLESHKVLAERKLTEKPSWYLVGRAGGKIPLRTAAAAMGLASIWTSEQVQALFEHATIRLVKDLCADAKRSF